MENIGRAQPALQCCTLHSLERDHIHLWSNTESKVQNELKTQVFLHILAQKCTILVNFPEKLSYFISKTHKNAVFLYVFEGLVQIEAIPYPIASIWLDCFEVETLEKHPNCKTLSRLSLPKMENTGRAQPALQCCTLHSLERDHTHLWSNIESKVQNELRTHGFLHILAQKCTILVNFPEKLS